MRDGRTSAFQLLLSGRWTRDGEKSESLAVRLISRSALPLSFTPQSVTPSSASIQSIYVIGGEMDIAHG